MKKNNYASIESIINIAKKGGMFILVDDEKRENEGDLIISTTDSNAKNINFMAKYGRGLICLALDSVQAKRLNLSLMSPINQSRNKTAFTISIEAKKGITTGISAKDRAKTIKIASKKNANKKDIVSPGHVFPIIAKISFYPLKIHFLILFEQGANYLIISIICRFFDCWIYSTDNYVRNLINISSANWRISRIDALVLGCVHVDFCGINWFWIDPFQKAQTVDP